MTETITYTAAIGLVSSVVAGEYCDVSVIENIVAGYRDRRAHLIQGDRA